MFIRKVTIPLLFAIGASCAIADEASDTSIPNGKDKKIDISEIAFKDSLKAMIPLSPEQINKFKDAKDEATEAIVSRPTATLSNKSSNITLKPGAETSNLTLVPGYVSTLVFVDSSGAPWPITSFTVGNPAWFNLVKPDGLESGNMLTINARQNHVNSNIVITLAKHASPIIIQLDADVDASKTNVHADGLVSYRIDERGPNALIPVIGTSIKSPVTEEMTAFLDNVPPPEAKLLKTDAGSEVSVWSFAGKFYLRSPLMLQWPAWSRVVQGHNITVHEIPQTPSIVVSDNGRQRTINIGD